MKKRDVIIIAGILAAALLVFLGLRLFPRLGGGEVLVYVEGALHQTAPLGQKNTLVIDQGNGKVNTLDIALDGTVSMASATCPHQDCVASGPVTSANADARPGRNWIICLPNRVSVEVRYDP